MLTEKRNLRKITKYMIDWKEENHRRLRPTSATVFTVASATPAPMNKMGTEKNCLYSCQKYLFKMCVVFGVVPVSIQESPTTGKCQCKHQWFSKESVINFAVLIIFASLGWPVYSIMKIYAVGLFGRTDYFFLVNSGLFRTVLTGITFAANNWRASTVAMAWNKLHCVMADTNFQNYEQLKKIGLIVFVLYATELSFHVVFGYIVTSNVFQFENPVPWIYVIQQFFSLFVVDLFIGFYSLTYAMIVLGLRNIAENVKICLEDFEMANHAYSRKDNSSANSIRSQHASNLADLRIKHERYCEVIRLLQKAFGVQLLAIICSTTVDFIGGVYCVIGSFEGLFADTTSNLVYFSGILMMAYGFRIIIILYFAELITNTAKVPAHHLNLLKTQNGNNAFFLEVELFLSKLANFPVEMSCCDILELSGGFLASAASHIVTYVLVLMQFRLGSETETNVCNSTIK